MAARTIPRHIVEIASKHSYASQLNALTPEEIGHQLDNNSIWQKSDCAAARYFLAEENTDAAGALALCIKRIEPHLLFSIDSIRFHTQVEEPFPVYHHLVTSRTSHFMGIGKRLVSVERSLPPVQCNIHATAARLYIAGLVSLLDITDSKAGGDDLFVFAKHSSVYKYAVNRSEIAEYKTWLFYGSGSKIIDMMIDLSREGLQDGVRAEPSSLFSDYRKASDRLFGFEKDYPAAFNSILSAKMTKAQAQKMFAMDRNELTVFGNTYNSWLSQIGRASCRERVSSPV